MTIADPNEIPVKLEGKFMAMVVCWILGFGSLASWNSMLTIGDYYYAIFPDYHPSRVLTLVYLSFALAIMALLAYNESKISTRQRNISGYILFFLSTLALILIDLASFGKGGIVNYIAICAFVAAFGVADALVQGGMVGDLALMRPEFIQCESGFPGPHAQWELSYGSTFVNQLSQLMLPPYEFLQSFFAGLAASGALTSALRLVTKASFENFDNGLRKGAMLFLGISTLCELLCVYLYASVFAKLPIVKYYRSKAAKEGSKTVSSDLAAAGIKIQPTGLNGDANIPESLSKKQLFLQNIDYALDLFFISALTLSIFPGFLYENTGTHHLGSWYPLVLIAMFNLWDLISRYLPLIACLKLESRKGLMIAVLSRFLFVPAFYFTAKYGDQGWMIMLVSLLGLTKGYLTVCVMTASPKGYKGPEANALGNILVLCLLSGIFSGAVLDWLWII